MGKSGSNRASLTVRTPVLRQKLDHAYVRVSAETVQGAISGARVRAGSVVLVRSWNPGCVKWRARRGEREVGDPGAPEVEGRPAVFVGRPERVVDRVDRDAAEVPAPRAQVSSHTRVHQHARLHRSRRGTLL